MTSSTQHRPNKLSQMKKILINQYLCILEHTIRISIAAKLSIYSLPIISVVYGISGVDDVIRSLICIF